MQAVKLTKQGKPDRRVLRRENHLKTLEDFLSKQRTVQECADKLAVTDRAIYQMIEQLNARKKLVARIGPKAAPKYTMLPQA